MFLTIACNQLVAYTRFKSQIGLQLFKCKTSENESYICLEYEPLELLRIYEQIREINDEQLTTNAAELFPEELSLSSIKLTESQIDSLLFILTKVEKRIKWLRLVSCFYKPEDVGRLFEAIQAMPGKVCLFILLSTFSFVFNFVYELDVS